MPKESLTREELTERLRAIADEEVEKPEFHGAMCYEPMVPQPAMIKCDICGCNIEVDTIQKNINSYLKHTATAIRKLNYDAKIDCFCSKCFSVVKLNTNKKTPYYVFFFKAKGDLTYHKALITDSNDLEIILSFLRNKNKYKVDSYNEGLIKDNLDVIERMTGIAIK